MESPFSWNCRYNNKGGFGCQITVRAVDSKTLLAKVVGVEKWLVESGATPAGPEAPVAVAGQAAGRTMER